MFDASGRPIPPDNPVRKEALRKVCGRLHRTLDEVLRELSAEQLASPDKMEQAVREALARRDPKYTFDVGTGELTVPDVEVGDGTLVVKGTLPAYTLIKNLALAIAGWKLVRWITVPELRLPGAIRRNPKDGLQAGARIIP